MSFAKRDIIGGRGENILELCLTDFSTRTEPFFQPSHLGEKWPGIDYYVELNGLKGKRPYFLIQCKTTQSPITTHLAISCKKNDIARLLEIPGPTYILGIHEPSKRVFAKSIHMGLQVKAVTRIELKNELTPMALQTLHTEVRDYWQLTPHKPTKSVFL